MKTMLYRIYIKGTKSSRTKFRISLLIITYPLIIMPNKEEVEGIAASVAGSVVGNKAADKAHLGGAGHMAAGILGGIGGGKAEQKADEKK